MKTEKTNAMRILDKEKLSYKVHTYAHGKEAIDGLHVAQLLKEDPEKVFKTLLCVSNKKQYYVFVVPVCHELSMKKCAKAVHEKNMEMIHVKDIIRISGYIRGGCSPIGMKKQYPTIFHETCMLFDTILFSGGKIGIQIEMKPKDAVDLLQAQCADIIL